jgi:hypothetical protein
VLVPCLHLFFSMVLPAAARYVAGVVSNTALLE